MVEFEVQEERALGSSAGAVLKITPERGLMAFSLCLTSSCRDGHDGRFLPPGENAPAL